MELADCGLQLSPDCSEHQRTEPPVWPEQPGRQAKMMLFEVLVNDLEAAVERVLACSGAEARHQPADRDPTRLRVMLDPVGHPFCWFVDGE